MRGKHPPNLQCGNFPELHKVVNVLLADPDELHVDVSSKRVPSRNCESIGSNDIIAMGIAMNHVDFVH